tara:strand:+ start:643 stop:831 length:189 start_codon:yes stop_codon:yes gene_type:complete
MSDTLITKIKSWLEDEVEQGQPVVDGEDDYSGWDTEDIVIGRHECAEGLLYQIAKWEKEVDG